MDNRTILALAAVLCVAASPAALSRDYFADIVVADGFPAVGSTGSGTHEDMGQWNSEQLVGIGGNRPFGSVAKPGVGFVAWEYFPGQAMFAGAGQGAFSNLAHQYSGKSGVLSGTLAQSNPDSEWSETITTENGSLLPNGTGGRLHAQALNFNATLSANSRVTDVVLQIKHSPYQNFYGGSEHVPQGTLTNPFWDATLNINGQSLAYDSMVATYLDNPTVGRYNPSETGTTTFYYITEYHWTGVDIDAFQMFMLSFSQPEDYFSIDTIAVYTSSAVPEPQTVALTLTALGLAFALVRRRGNRK